MHTHTHTHKLTHTHSHTLILYIYIYVYVLYMCVYIYTCSSVVTAPLPLFNTSLLILVSLPLRPHSLTPLRIFLQHESLLDLRSLNRALREP